ncbi:alanine racemase [Acidaminobacter sp. JC074]|uniref:alanine racemase n=1 Tax=Acidaminobacter sp. JC074 TaxID=2530199 RepID=UPI001F0E33A4|nr:alanine racemase [Acidaminobacter sp. JC074]MCH4887490.1 alanine racemase [Acidaminobacter sp. JC074]
MYRDTYVEINLDNLAFNLKSIKDYVGKDVCVAAVVKANAYGHGAVEIVRTAIENQVEVIAVATLTEALELRRHFDVDIFIMGYTPSEYLDQVVKEGITQCIFSYEQAVKLAELGKVYQVRPKVHIKYDTGFNRLGFRDCDESIETIKKILELDLDVEGIFSHFALAGHEENVLQVKRLNEAIEKIDYNFKYKHICDSIAAVEYPEFHMDMVRVGALIYGLSSFRTKTIPLKQVMQFKSKVYYVKDIEEGEGISYNYKWQAKRKSRIATLPLGYSDGYPRNMFEKGMVTIKGHRVPVVGVICMDQCMVDITDYPDIKEGDEVVIYGDGSDSSLSIAEAALLGQTNKNELISRITRRTPRIYIKEGKVYKELDYLLEGV